MKIVKKTKKMSKKNIIKFNNIACRLKNNTYIDHK